MRVSPARRRRAGLTLALALAALLTLPAAAMADSPRIADCDDLLVTIAPTETVGEPRAAAVTAQVHVADQPGWASVTWAVPDTTTLRDVLVLHTDGTTRSAGAQRTGTADDVLQLGFCGHLASVEVEPGDPAEADVQIVPDPAPQPDTGPSSSTDEAAGGEADGSDTGEADATDTRQDGAARSDDGAGHDATGPDSSDAAEDAADADATTAAGDDTDQAAIVPVGPDAGPYYDAARATTGPGHAQAGALPETTLLTAPADGTITLADSGAPGTKSTSKAGQGSGPATAVLGLLLGSLVGVGVLGARYRFAGEVAA